MDSHELITSAKLDQVHKYRSLTGHVYSPAIFLMNKAQWDKLSDADKQELQQQYASLLSILQLACYDSGVRISPVVRNCGCSI